MGKAGFFFYTGDWLKDTKALSLEAKGAWIDLLCALYECDGTVTWPLHAFETYLSTGSKYSISQIFEEYRKVHICYVSQHSNGDVTLMSRRITREVKAKKNDRLRQSKSRRHRKVTALSRKNRASLLNPSLNPSPSLNLLKEEGLYHKPPPVAFELPPFIEKKVWDAFVEMRNKERHPLTDHAKNVICQKLDAFRAAGHDPNKILNNSIVNNWRDVYEPKGGTEGELSPEIQKILKRGL